MKWTGVGIFLALLLSLAPHLALEAVADTAPTPSPDQSPVALAASPDGNHLYVACATANQVLAVDLPRQVIAQRFTVPGAPSGLALSVDGAKLFVTCAAPVSQVCILDTASGKTLKSLPARHTALAPVLSRDGKTLFICNRFNDEVAVYDLEGEKEESRIPVTREPVSAVLTTDGRFLLVANHLPSAPADAAHVAALVSVIDVAARKVTKELSLPNGAINVREIRPTTDGKYAAMALTIGRFQVPVTQINRGWVNTSAVCIIDLSTMEVVNTVLLDEVEQGAANPWGVAWSADSRHLCVSHAGTHELSLIGFPALLKKLSALPPTPGPGAITNLDVASRCRADVPNDLSFLSGLRQRIKLRGSGPRAVTLIGTKAYAAMYFSDTIEVVALRASPPHTSRIDLNPGYTPSQLRKGEMYFNDATICFQGWQSCASCHDDDARVDGVNWDLLNDGIGNPKDTKSLVLSHQTPPVMSLGVRSTANVAVRAGIHSSLVAEVPDEVPEAIDEWLKSLKPAPSPRLVNHQLSEAAKRGEKVFMATDTACAACHKPKLYTDLRSRDVGTRSAFDQGATDFDTPTLVELWRTAPYLHDGSAATLREVLTSKNQQDRHGKTSHLTSQQLDDLIEFLLSL